MTRYRSFTIYCSIFFYAINLRAQCPEESFLWNRIIYLRDSSTMPSNDQLNELVSYKDKIKSCGYRNDSTHVLLLARIGWLFSLRKDYVQAIQYTREATDIIHQHIDRPYTNSSLLLRCYNNLTILYDSLKQLNLQAESADSCIAVAVRLKTGYNFAVQWIYWKTEYCLGKGDYYQCINYADLGERIAREGYQVDDVYYYISWKINALIFLRRYAEAEDLLAKTIDDCRRNRAYQYLGSFYGLLANISEKKGDLTKTMFYVDNSLSFDKKVKNYNGCAGTLNNIGYNLYFLKLHQYDKSLQYYYQALKYADNIESLNILDNIANIYTEKNMYDSAIYFYQDAFDYLKPGLKETDLLTNVNLYFINRNISKYIFDLVLDKAECYLKNYKKNNGIQNIEETIRIYKNADKLLNKIKTEQSDFESKLFWRTHAHRLYEHAVEACFLDNDIASAFYFFEKSRAILLNDQLTEQHWVNNEDILRLAEAQKKIIQIEREVSDASGNRPKLQNDLFLTKQEFDRLRQLIKNRNPVYYQNFVDTVSLGLQELREKILKERQGLIELFNGDSAVYSLIITPQEKFLTKIDKTDYDRTTKLYISFISNPDLLNNDYAGYKKTAHHLYQLIFPNNQVPNGRIIISPDGQYFPFEALITNSDTSSPVYFLNDHSVSYTYSARFLLNNFTNSTSEKNKNFLGIAPVKYASSLSLTALNGSDHSLNKIENYFTGAVNFISSQASKNNFETEFSKYKLIQLYTHASDSSKNNEPVIYFADSALYLSDLIPENKPATQLIVLSACETGKGQFYRGEGVFSFNRGFAALGIPSSVTNLWSVDNKSTYAITELFYKYLSKGLPLDIALQKAKKEFIQSGSKEYSLPYFWAASVLVGKTDAIDDSSNYFSWKLAVLSASVCLLLFLAAKYFSGRIFANIRNPFTPTPDKGGTVP